MRLNKHHPLYALAFACSLPGTLHAQSTQASLNLTTQQYHYRESSESGEFLDKETGIVPGIQMTVQSPLPNDFAAFATVDYADGQLDYDGHSSAGARHTTKSDFQQWHIQAGVSHSFYIEMHSIVWGLTLGHHTWQRDILPSNGVLGLSEKYQWFHAGAFVSAPLWQHNQHSFEARVQGFRLFEPTIQVDLQPIGGPETTLDLKTNWGFDSQLQYRYQLNTKTQIHLQSGWQQWRFGASDSKLIQTNSGIALINEPRSQTRTIHLQAGLTLLF